MCLCIYKHISFLIRICWRHLVGATGSKIEVSLDLLMAGGSVQLHYLSAYLDTASASLDCWQHGNIADNMDL